MNREIHVRFWEGLGVRFPRATHCTFLEKIIHFRSLGNWVYGLRVYEY